MANYIATDTDLAAVANAIRTKGGTSAQLEFPGGFVNAINAISGGGGSLGEFSQCDYVDVQTADVAVLTATNPLGVEPKLVTVEALTNPDPTSIRLKGGWYTPYGGSVVLFTGAYLVFAEPICNRTDTLDSNIRSYVMDQNSLQAHRYNANSNWDTTITYRCRFYA